MGEVVPDFDLYGVLQVTPEADTSVIVAAHRALIARHHPDMGDQSDKATRLNTARDWLTDPARRARYDATRAASTKAGSTTAAAARPGDRPVTTVRTAPREPKAEGATRGSTATPQPAQRTSPRQGPTQPQGQTWTGSQWAARPPAKPAPDFATEPLRAARALIPVVWVAATLGFVVALAGVAAGAWGSTVPDHPSAAIGLTLVALVAGLVFVAEALVYVLAIRLELRLRKQRAGRRPG